MDEVGELTYYLQKNFVGRVTRAFGSSWFDIWAEALVLVQSIVVCVIMGTTLSVTTIRGDSLSPFKPNEIKVIASVGVLKACDVQQVICDYLNICVPLTVCEKWAGRAGILVEFLLEPFVKEQYAIALEHEKDSTRKIPKCAYSWKRAFLKFEQSRWDGNFVQNFVKSVFTPQRMEKEIQTGNEKWDTETIAQQLRKLHEFVIFESSCDLGERAIEELVELGVLVITEIDRDCVVSLSPYEYAVKLALFYEFANDRTIMHKIWDKINNVNNVQGGFDFERLVAMLLIHCRDTKLGKIPLFKELVEKNPELKNYKIYVTMFRKGEGLIEKIINEAKNKQCGYKYIIASCFPHSSGGGKPQGDVDLLCQVVLYGPNGIVDVLILLISCKCIRGATKPKAGKRKSDSKAEVTKNSIVTVYPMEPADVAEFGAFQKNPKGDEAKKNVAKKIAAMTRKYGCERDEKNDDDDNEDEDEDDDIIIDGCEFGSTTAAKWVKSKASFLNTPEVKFSCSTISKNQISKNVASINGNCDIVRLMVKFVGGSRVRSVSSMSLVAGNERSCYATKIGGPIDGFDGESIYYGDFSMQNLRECMGHVVFVIPKVEGEIKTRNIEFTCSDEENQIRFEKCNTKNQGKQKRKGFSGGEPLKKRQRT